MFENYVVLMMQMIVGIQAIAPRERPVPLRRAAIYARAAVYHAQKAHLDPFELVALARNESDFDDRTVGPDGLDCGLTQTRITYSRYTCEELKRSPFIAFAEAARELSAYEKSCRGRGDFDRCRLNRYNSGYRYARSGFHGRYYLRLGCFAAAARRQLPFEGRCRSVQSEEQLALWIRQATGEPDDQALAGASLLTPARAGAAASHIRSDSSPPWQVTVLAIAAPDAERPTLGLLEPGGERRRRTRRQRRRGGEVRLRRLRRLERALAMSVLSARTSGAGPTPRGGHSSGADPLRSRTARAPRVDLPGCG